MNEAPEYVELFDDGTVVMVSKVGGGTLGKAYEGWWSYLVFAEGEVLCKGDDFHVGLPYKHEYVAHLVNEWFMEDEV